MGTVSLTLISFILAQLVPEQELKIVDFESTEELALVEPSGAAKLELADKPIKSGRKSLRVVLPGGQYPGISITIRDGNWFGYDVLRIRVYSPRRIAFGIRVDDVNSRNYATRFNLETEVYPGWNLFQIPTPDIGERIDITKVRRLVLFGMKPPPGTALFFDDIALGKRLDEPAHQKVDGNTPLEVGYGVDLSQLPSLKKTMLFDFEDSRSLKSIFAEGGAKYELSQERKKSGELSLKIALPKGAYPGIELRLERKDWREYDKLFVWVYSDKILKFGVRVDDTFSTDYYTRYNREDFRLTRGWTPIVLKLKEVGEVVELDSIKKLVLFVLDCPGASIYVDSIALAKAPPRKMEETLLFSFESETELKRVHSDTGTFSLSTERVREGRYALKVELPPGPWPGISLSPLITDWSGYEALKFDVYCPRNSGFGIRIDDASSRDYHSRYNEETVVLKGWNTHQVDLRKVKPINPARMRSLVLFLLNNKEKTIIYFDNIRLGAYDEELHSPIAGEEGPRRDIVYSTRVKTPHTRWAKPYYSGKIRIFAIPSITDGRDLSELMQRLSLEVSAVTIDPEWDANCWGIGDYYGRGEQNDYRLVYKYVEDELCSEKKFDVLILTTPTGWTDFTPATRRAILRRVKKGAGAVLIYPFMTKDKKTDQRIWGLSPLYGVLNNSVGGRGYLRVNWRALAEGEWRKTTQHYITRGIPFQLFPSGFLKHFRYRSRGTIIARAGSDPLIAVREYGKGRVVTFAYKNAGFTPPAVDPVKTQTTWDYWEYYYDLLIRAIIWSARRESPVAIQKFAYDGRKASLSVSSDRARTLTAQLRLKNQWAEVELTSEINLKLKAGRTELVLPFPNPELSAGMHIIDIILREDGKSLDWATALYYSTPPAKVLSIRVPELCPEDGDITADIATSHTVREDTLRVALEDEWQRRLEEQDLTARSALKLKLSTKGALSEFVRIVAELKRGKTLIDRKFSRDVYLAPLERAPVNFRAELGWAGRWKRYFRPTVRRLIADRATTIGAIGRAFLNNSIGVYGLGFVRWNIDQYRKQKRLYNATEDKAYLMRHPCLSSPEYQQDIRRRVARAIRARSKYRLPNYYVVDEGSLTSYGDAFDFCYSPHCLSKFRDWLKKKYRDIFTLNEVWGTEYEEWEEAEPVTTAEAKKNNNFAPWGDHRLFMVYTYAGAFKLIRDTIRAIDKDGRTIVSGTQAPNPWNGCDWYWLDQFIDDISCYSGGEQWELHRSFKPEAPIGFWTGYGRHGPALRHTIWSALFHRLTRPHIFWGYSFLNPDFTYSKSGWDMGEVFRAIRDSGLGQVVLRAKRNNDGIALHYSYPSILSAEALGRRRQFERNKSAWVRLIQDSGFQFDFVARPQIEAGVLQKRAYRVLILPMSTALSDREVEQINSFVRNGGSLIMDTQAGLMKENCAYRRTSPWGLRESLIRGGLKAPSELRVPELKTLGTGKIIHFGFPVFAYLGARRRNYGGREYRELLRNSLSSLGVKPLFRISTSKGELRYAETVIFSLGQTRVLCILKEPSAHEQKLSVRFRKRNKVVDLLSAKPLGKLAQLEFSAGPAEPVVISVEPPEQEIRLKVECPRAVKRGEVVPIGIRFGSSTQRVFVINFLTPAGKRMRLYSKVIYAERSPVRLEHLFALNDPAGQWKLEVRDILSAQTLALSLTVR